MKITDIRQQVKRADRYSVYIDGKYDFSVSANELLGLGLVAGQEFDGEQLGELRLKALLDKAYDSALNLISRRRRSCWELEQYLKHKGYDMDHISIIINKLSDRGFVDDSEFARAWINSRRLLKATSKRRLAQELRAKRIDDNIIDDALSQDTQDDRTVLKDLVTRKRRQAKYQDNLKLMQYLSRQGFNYDDIKAVLTRADDLS